MIETSLTTRSQTNQGILEVIEVVFSIELFGNRQNCLILIYYEILQVTLLSQRNLSTLSHRSDELEQDAGKMEVLGSALIGRWLISGSRLLAATVTVSLLNLFNAVILLLSCSLVDSSLLELI